MPVRIPDKISDLIFDTHYCIRFHSMLPDWCENNAEFLDACPHPES
jgi:hypothetical protein